MNPTGEAATLPLFSGQVVLVTGGGSGIGEALCRRAARDGARVAVADRDGAAAHRVAASFGGASHRALELDVTDESAVARVVDQVETELGPLDALFSNAGINRGHGLGATADWTASFAVHALAHLHFARILVPRMTARGNGHFVITASAAGLLSNPGSASYTVSKHAAVAFAEWLEINYGDRGLHVACVCPQAVRTGMTAGRDDVPGEAAGWLEPDDVVDAVWAALGDKRFLVLPHPEVQRFEQRRAADRERWLAGMRRTQQQARGQVTTERQTRESVV
jgi:NAD(P)-dependent dehydrogenase (short-subunit alcohol dehydrogenase family)